MFGFGQDSDSDSEEITNVNNNGVTVDGESKTDQNGGTNPKLS